MQMFSGIVNAEPARFLPKPEKRLQRHSWSVRASWNVHTALQGKRHQEHQEKKRMRSFSKLQRISRGMGVSVSGGSPHDAADGAPVPVVMCLR